MVLMPTLQQRQPKVGRMTRGGGRSHGVGFWFITVGSVALLIVVSVRSSWRQLSPNSLTTIFDTTTISANNQQEQQVALKVRSAEEQEAAVKAAAEAAAAEERKRKLTADECRGVFKGKGQGGYGESTHKIVQQKCKSSNVYDVCADLLNFTGLSNDEFLDRMARKGRFHFEGEHDFWNPTSTTELAWYYSTSVDYLFANALHGVWTGKINRIASKDFEPILDYSGGVGNNILHLAKQGLKCQYFGIGMMEYQFAEYRVWKRRLEPFVSFLKPFSEKTGYKFDPINGPLPRDGSLGAIIAMDVFEHIPKYHLVVEAMVESLRVGGAIIEDTPFARQLKDDSNEDLRVHLSNGGIDMKTAMGPKMKFDKGIWIKIAE